MARSISVSAWVRPPEMWACASACTTSAAARSVREVAGLLMTALQAATTLKGDSLLPSTQLTSVPPARLGSVTAKARPKPSRPARRADGVEENRRAKCRKADMTGVPKRGSSRSRSEGGCGSISLDLQQPLQALAHRLLQVVTSLAEVGVAAGEKIVLRLLQGAAGARAVGHGVVHDLAVHRIDLAVEIGEIGTGADRLLHRALCRR